VTFIKPEFSPHIFEKYSITKINPYPANVEKMVSS